ncbi:MAG: transferase hexapeptide repeat containing protein [Capsulimonas sp.]|jgi:carbonic anhydrase/acetyltransferase-like protein (isoleucine patch superfamily)|nr:transferase hexapeptide repeat containing protein [Capsulimonas sp.]
MSGIETVPSNPVAGKLRRISQRMARESRGLLGVFRPRIWFWTGLARLLPDFAATSLRTQFFRMAGCDIAPGVALLGSPKLIGSGNIAARLHIASGAIVAPGVTFGLDAEITIGEKVSISPMATIYTATHAMGFGSQRMNPAVSPKAVVVERGAWVGMQALILPGVTLGQGCVISAGSVVAQNVTANTLAAGNPATEQQKLPFGNR